ncbi:inactive transglutaminase family protein [Legionella gresilensis]|uniref:inactive transglutaminase family protein n=1 Tax=Legionella gresilensis TaxID=91823 RepID=UPI0010419DD5|nr:inactive transglutaminase family protein [Legionella gresilensis]
MKSNKHHVYGLIITLFVLGIGLFLYRHLFLDVPLTDTETVNSWMVEANLRFTAERNTPVKANFIIPYMPPYFAILDEYFVSHNYGITTNLVGYNRQTVWSLRRGAGDQSLYYRAIFRETDTNEATLPKPPAIKMLSLAENQKSAVNNITNLVRQSSADIQTFAQGTIKELNKKEGNAKLLIGSDFSEDNVLNAAILILNQAKIYAMPVKGVYLSQQNKAEFKSFMAVYNGKEWLYINPRTGSAGLPKNFLVWQYGSEPLYTVVGGKRVAFNLTISPTPINALTIAKARGLQTDSEMLRFSLLQLPVNAQETYKILLTVPIGAFIILLLRNFVGLKTFGTFMPVLIALAFRETHVIWGISLFILIVSFGLLARFYLDQLRLLLVPRLAAILTIVILLMIFISVMSQNLGLESGLSVALFPMVILTMTIERMCITWDERGPSEAIKSGLGSLFAAIIAFGAMSYSPIQYLFFAFPELLLVLLALILFVGQYRGYRLFELFRFKVLAGAGGP